MIDYKMNAETGSYKVTGQNAKFTHSIIAKQSRKIGG